MYSDCFEHANNMHKNPPYQDSNMEDKIILISVIVMDGTNSDDSL